MDEHIFNRAMKLLLMRGVSHLALATWSIARG